MRDGNVTAECLILEPVNIAINMARNLAAGWYHKAPDIDISGKLEAFSVSSIYVHVCTFIHMFQCKLVLKMSKNIHHYDHRSGNDIYIYMFHMKYIFDAGSIQALFECLLHKIQIVVRNNFRRRIVVGNQKRQA